MLGRALSGKIPVRNIWASLVASIIWAVSSDDMPFAEQYLSRNLLAMHEVNLAGVKRDGPTVYIGSWYCSVSSVDIPFAEQYFSRNLIIMPRHSLS